MVAGKNCSVLLKFKAILDCTIRTLVTKLTEDM